MKKAQSYISIPQVLAENILDEFLTHLEVCSSDFQEDIFFKIIQKLDSKLLRFSGRNKIYFNSKSNI